MRVDLVAPPFAGHLFPLLDLASYLSKQGLIEIRILSTADAANAIQLCGLKPVALLPGDEAKVWAISSPHRRIGGNPMRLCRQFRMNLELMMKLREQLRAMWHENRPDLVIVDFTIPVAGLLASELCIPWWTSLPSPCVLESKSGVPSYLGGWRPRTDWLGRIRDLVGRGLIHSFKRTLAGIFARELRALGVKGVYRTDGTEAVYSPERILALGIKEFEFARDWPDALSFVGPLTGAPPFPHAAPAFEPGRRSILISLGTHLQWAKDHAARLMAQVAHAMPDCVFHFAHGKPGSNWAEHHGNMHHYGFLPYNACLQYYEAAIIHGGTGLTYSCIEQGKPMLVWPHDFDQFDHAARIVENGLGLRLRPKCDDVVRDLRLLLTDESIRSTVRRFQGIASSYDARASILESIKELHRGADGLVQDRPTPTTSATVA